MLPCHLVLAILLQNDAQDNAAGQLWIQVYHIAQEPIL